MVKNNSNILLKEWVGESLVGRRANFRCACLIKLDFTGKVVSYRVSSNEVIWTVDLGGGKTTEIGENTPNLFISFLD